MKKTLSGLVKFHERKNGYCQFTRITLPEMAEEGEKKRRRRNRDKNMTAWERVETARDSKRPTSLDYIETVLKNLWNCTETGHFGMDGAIVGGLAVLDGSR